MKTENQKNLAVDLAPASALFHESFSLVRLVDFTKQPLGEAWNAPESAAKSIDGNATGYGLPLAANNLCSIDPDNIELARVGMKALGFDLDYIMSQGVRTLSTRKGSGGRSTFAAEGDISWLKFGSLKTGTILELRASSPNLQDCVPGLLYKDKAGNLCTQKYANGKTFIDARDTPLPDDLYTFWQKCSTDIEFLHRAQGKFYTAVEKHLGCKIGGNKSISTGKGGSVLAFPAPGIRSKFNEQNRVQDLLTATGKYWLDPKTQRWTHEGSEGAPGIRPIPGCDDLWHSDHGSDPLNGTFDAWIVNVIYNHGGDVHAAKAAWSKCMDDDHAARREQQRAEAASIGEGEDDADIPEVMSVDEMRERLVFLAEGSRVVDANNPAQVLSLQDFRNLTRASRTEIETGTFERDGTEKTKQKLNADLWMDDLARKTAHSITFKADGKRFENDPDGRRCVNSWRGYSRPVEAEGLTAELFVNHIRWLFKERAEDFLDWLAHIEQKPGVLPHTAWLHISSNTGTGRNWVSSVLARVFAGHIATSIDLVQMLKSGFNSRLSRKTLAICDEIREGGSGKWDHAEKLKEMITVEVRTINPKFGRESLEFNACRFLLFSNHRAAIPIDDTDRRFEVVICDDAPKPGEYYAELYGMLDKPGFIAAVGNMLARRDISGFKPGRHATVTVDKQQVIASSQSEEVSSLIEFTNNYPCELATSERLSQESGIDTQSKSAQFSRVVEDAGWVRLGRKSLIGKRTYIYARKSVSTKWATASGGYEIQIPVIDGGAYKPS